MFMLSLTQTQMFEIIAAQFPLWDTTEDADIDIVQPHIAALEALTKDLPILGHDLHNNIHIYLKNAVRKCPTVINEEALVQILKEVCLQAETSLQQYPEFDTEKATQLGNIIITAMVKPCIMYNNLSAPIPPASSAVIISRPHVQNVREEKNVNEAKQMILGYIDNLTAGLQSNDINVVELGPIMADIVRPQEVQFTQDELQEMITGLESLNTQCASSATPFLASAIQQAINPCLDDLKTRKNNAAPKVKQ